jgi:hypothetical protein
MNVVELQQYEDQLGFRPEQAVRWLSPPELWRAGVKVVLSSVFASYADKREAQAGLTTPQPMTAARTAADGDVWVDFVADLGDGFDATYTIASLLACDKLEPIPSRALTASSRCPAPRCSCWAVTRSTPPRRHVSTRTG